MTHEEKYKEALLEARAVLEPCLKYSNGKVREALDSIDNELKRFESEDERIRKEIISIVKEYGRICEKEGDPCCTIGDCLAYLEKQKEPENTSASTMAPSCWQKEQKDYNKLYEDIGKSEWFKKAYEGKSLGCDYEQKEQKPDWSDEDVDMLNSCISSIEEAKENRYAYKETDGDTSYDREIDWLKSLRPQYHGDVTMTEAYKMGLEAGKASSWKPSEEQMKAFEDAMSYIPEFYKPKSNLVSLLRDLKKL